MRTRLERGRGSALFLWIALALGSACQGAPTPPPKNLVIVSIDTLRADRLGLHGYARDTSPHLDRWAAEAVVFENAISLANETVSSHHGLFQSAMPSRALPRRRSAPTLASILRRHGFRTAAFTDGGPMSPEFGFERGFEVFDHRNEGLAESLPKALVWLDELAGGVERFYLFLHCFDVHLPYDPPAPYAERFLPEYRGELTGAGTLATARRIRRIFEFEGAEPGFDLDEEDRLRMGALYDGEIAKTDDLLQRVAARLEREDLVDDTLVVILSDHGEEFWDHGSVLHAHTLYQELLHVPLILRVPGLGGGARRVAAPVSLLDVAPTLLELLKVPAPDSMQGTSLVPLLEAGSPPDRPVLSEGFALGTSLQSVVLGRWKLIRRSHEPEAPVELYDLESDPLERSNLAEERPETVQRLVAILGGVKSDSARVEHQLDPLDELDQDTLRRLRELGYVE